MLVLVAVVGSAGLSGVRAVSFGAGLSTRPAPLESVAVLALGGFATVTFAAARQSIRTLERADVEHLRVLLPDNQVAAGFVATVSGKLGVVATPALVAVAVGVGVGTGSLLSAATTLSAGAALFLVATLVGVAAAFGVTLLQRVSPLARTATAASRPVAFAVGLLLWMVVVTGPAAVPSVAPVAAGLPSAWFVDLALAATPAASGARAAAAVGITLVAVPATAWAIVGLAERAWAADHTGKRSTGESKRVPGGILDTALLRRHVSLPVRTVASKRWVQERRVPSGLYGVAYLLFLTPAVFLPAFAARTVPGVSLVAAAFLVASSTGLVFGLRTLASDYRSLSATLTAVPASTFVRGVLFAGVASGGPVVVATTLVLGAFSPLHGLELAVLAVAGVALCACSVATGAALASRIEYLDFQPVPLPFTDAVVYDVVGRRGFVHLAAVVGFTALVCVPPGIAYGLRFAPQTGTVGQPPWVGIAALALTIVAAGASTLVAYRRAVRRIENYTLP